MKKNYKKILTAALTTIGVAALFGSLNFFSSFAFAAFNPEINYQGKLTNSSNVAVADGVYHMKFRLYTALSGGTAIWEENRSYAGGDRITLASGLFSVMLGSSTSLSSVNFNQTIFLEVEIGGTSSTTWEILSPRKKLGAVPAAFEADKLDGVDSSSFLRSDEADSASGLLTFSGGVISQASTTVSSTLRVTGESIFNSLVDASRFVATSTTATSTFAGKFAVGTSTPGASSLFTAGTSTPLLHVDNNSGFLGLGTSAPSQQLEITGNLRLPASTAAAGIIYSGANRYIHNFGTNNFFAGVNAGNLTMTGSDNTAIGFNALLSNTSGIENIAIGSYVLDNNTTGYGNTGIGAYALTSNSSGFRNLAIGSYALTSNNSGSSNIAIGRSSLYYNTTGYQNIAIGDDVLADNSSGYANISIGYTAGRYISGGGANQTSNNSVYLGYDARALASGDTNEIVIGASAVGIGSNSVVLGNDSILTTALKGSIAIGTTSPWAKLSIQNTFGADNPIFDVASSTNANGSATSSVFRVSAYDNVGIGTTSPYARLSVEGSSALGNSALAGYFTATSTTATSTFAGGLAVETSGLVYDYSTNNVGIGTASPTEALEVTGNIKLSGVLTASNRIRAWTGTVGAPTFAEITDTDTGLYLEGSNILSLVTSGSRRLTIDANGNIGIGTTSPYARLSVEGSSALGNSALAGYFTATSTTATSTFSGGFTAGNNAALTVNQAASANSLYINASGNVGIGTTAPGYLLEVNGAYKIGGSTGGIIYASGFIRSSGSLSYPDIYGDGTNPLVIAGKDNGTGVVAIASLVGIGTTGPDAKLDVLSTTEQLRLTYTDGTVYSSFIVNSGGDLTIAPSGGDTSITGNLAVSGTMSAATTTLATTTLSGPLLFSPDNTYDIGASGATRPRTGYYGTSLVVGNTATLTTNALNFSATSTMDLANTALNIDSNTLYIDAANNRVGVGTAAPAEKLDVNGNIQSNGTLTMTADVAGFEITTPGIYTTGRIRIDSDLLVGYSSGSGGVAYFNGLVGIGTTSPYARLSVEGSSALGNSALAGYFTATTTTATSTFAGGLSLTGGGISPGFNFSTTTRFYQNGQHFLTSSTTAAGNLTIGYQTSSKLDESGGLYNTYLGYQAGFSATSTGYNTGVGYQALYNLTPNSFGNNSYNTAIGYRALYANTESWGNTAVGHGALDSLVAGGYRNTAVGYNALTAQNSWDSVAVGYNALAAANANWNIGIGFGAGDNISSGGGNIIIGYNIDAPSATRNYQLNIGNLIYGGGLDGASQVVSTGSIAIGTSTPWARLSVQNTFGGDNPLFDVASSTSASYATSSVFRVSAYDNVGISTTSPWAKLAVNPVAGDTNQFVVGSSTATSFLITPSGNIGIGTTSPYAKLAVHANLLDNANPLFTVASSTAATTTYFIITNNGSVGIGTTSPWKGLSVIGSISFNGLNNLVGATSDGSLCLSDQKIVTLNSNSDICATSLRSLKHQIQSLDLDGIMAVNKLLPVSFVYNKGDGRTRYGFIAEDTAAVDLHFGAYDANGALYNVDDRAILAVTVKAIQETNLRIDELTPTVNSAVSETGGTGGIAVSFSWVLEQFKNIGVAVSDGVIAAKEFIADKITARKVVTEAFEMKDSVTGDVWCVRISQGEWNKFRGTCPPVGEASGETPGNGSEPESVPPTTPPPVEQTGEESPPETTTAPEPAPEPEPAPLEIPPTVAEENPAEPAPTPEPVPESDQTINEETPPLPAPPPENPSPVEVSGDEPAQ